MKTSKMMMSMLAAAAICASPAYANWFSNPRTNTNLNIGSAPNPTPADLRGAETIIPHSSGHFGEPTRLGANELYQHDYTFEEQTIVPQKTALTDAQLTALEGKTVRGAHGARLGYILAVDHNSRVAEIQTPGGIGVAVPTMLLADKGNHIAAPTMSRTDMTAMAKSQTGRTLAMNVGLNGTFRG